MKPRMTFERWQTLKQIFNEALEQKESRRNAYIRKACKEDTELLEEVLSLLEAYTKPGILDHPPNELAASVLAHPTTGEKKGKQIGPYEIVDLLGHGGMGSVYLAKRIDGHFEQKVALKLLKTSFASENQIRRFLAERQILATFNHEHVARLYDGGITDNGQPWFAMEYVDGRPINEFCNAYQFTINQRLKLFVRVCQAVQYAHRKLVVHRDLKPTNILVTEEGVVKLLDFGIAKTLNQHDPQPKADPLTHTGLLPLTPAYASPEQVCGEPVTTASDIYQLGVILYELLCNCRPYNVSGKTPSELERIICKTQPAYPSTSVSKKIDPKGAPGPEITNSRKTSPDQLRKQLRGDIDTIVMKALRKEPDRRYESADQLATDIRNYLSGRPVAAHPDSIKYRMRKFIRRHKTGVATATFILLLFIGYAITITWHSQRTQLALKQAQQETVKAEQVTGFLIDMFEATNPGEAMGDSVTTRILIEHGVAQAEQLDGQPDIQARMFDVAGQVYLSLGQYKDAQLLIERGLRLRKETFGNDHLSVSESLHNLARVYNENGDYNRAGNLYQKALELRRKHLPPNDPRIAESLYHMGMFYQRSEGNLQAAESFYRRSLEIRLNTYNMPHGDVAESLRGLGGALLAKGKYAEAEQHYLKALDIQENLLGKKHPETLTTVNNLAILKAWDGNYSMAASLLKETLGQRNQVLGAGHPSVAIQLNNLAFIAGHQGDFEEAENLLKEAISVMHASVGGDHPHALVFKTNLARTKHVRGDYKGAETLHRETLRTKRDLLGPDHPDVAASLIQLGSLLKDQHKYREAESLLRKAISIHRNALGNEHPLLISGYYLLAQIHVSVEDYQTAGNLFSETLKIREQTQAVDHPNIAVAHSLQGACLTNLELYGEAESLITEVRSLLDKFSKEEQMLKQQLIKRIINLYEGWEKPNDAAKYRRLLASVESHLN